MGHNSDSTGSKVHGYKSPAIDTFDDTDGCTNENEHCCCSRWAGANISNNTADNKVGCCSASHCVVEAADDTDSCTDDGAGSDMTMLAETQAPAATVTLECQWQ